MVAYGGFFVREKMFLYCFHAIWKIFCLEKYKLVVMSKGKILEKLWRAQVKSNRHQVDCYSVHMQCASKICTVCGLQWALWRDLTSLPLTDE